MIDYTLEINHYKRERNKTKSEINDSQSMVKPVSCKEKYNETATTRKLTNKSNFIETSIVS